MPHCPTTKPYSIVGLKTEMEAESFADRLIDEIEEFVSDLAIDCVHGYEEDWAECTFCESRVIDAAEKAHKIINRKILERIRANLTYGLG